MTYGIRWEYNLDFQLLGKQRPKLPNGPSDSLKGEQDLSRQHWNPASTWISRKLASICSEIVRQLKPEIPSTEDRTSAEIMIS